MAWFEVTYKIGRKMDTELVKGISSKKVQEKIEKKFDGDVEVLEVEKVK